MTVVAIDGPAGAGKSTVARKVAETLGFRYLDTGAMYRAIALAALQRSVPVDDEAALGELASTVALDIDDSSVFLEGADVTSRIRDSDVTRAVSSVSAHPAVRRAMVSQQRAAAARADVVIEGRDIGSVVFPDAEVKVFLTASLDERAKRRSVQAGVPTDDDTLEHVRTRIAERDDADSSRAHSPLKRADDAEEVDTTGLDIDEVVSVIVELVRRRDG